MVLSYEDDQRHFRDPCRPRITNELEIEFMEPSCRKSQTNDPEKYILRYAFAQPDRRTGRRSSGFTFFLDNLSYRSIA
jgi:hypothetical protein